MLKSKTLGHKSHKNKSSNSLLTLEEVKIMSCQSPQAEMKSWVLSEERGNELMT